MKDLYLSRHINKRRLKKGLKRISLLPLNRYLFLYLANKILHAWLKITGSTCVARPSNIMLELTNHCNLACTTCPREYDYGKEMDRGSIDMARAKRIIDELWPTLDSVGLTGMGETFLYRDIETIVDYIRQKNRGIIISVSTNAVLPGFTAMMEKLVNKLDTVQISIDGLDEVYESIRRKASFKELDANLRAASKLCKGSGTTLMLNMVVTRENFMHMPALIDYAEETGISYLDFTLFNLAAVIGIEEEYYDFYSSTEFREVVDALEQKICSSNMVTVANRNFKTGTSFRDCPFPWTHFTICWNGFVPPCCAKPFPKELNFGNVFETGVMDVLNSEKFRAFRKLWKTGKTPEFCRKCHFIGKGKGSEVTEGMTT